MTDTVKNGTSKKSAKERKFYFAEAYLSNGGNQTQAAITAGYPVRSARQTGYQLMKDEEVRSIVEEAQAQLRAKFSLTSERVYQEIARISYYDPRKLVDKDGKIIPLKDLDSDTAAAIGALEMEVQQDGNVSYRVRPHSKTTALDQACKLLRLFDAPPISQTGSDGNRDPKETAKWLAFMLDRGTTKRLEGPA